MPGFPLATGTRVAEQLSSFCGGVLWIGQRQAIYMLAAITHEQVVHHLSSPLRLEDQNVIPFLIAVIQNRALFNATATVVLIFIQGLLHTPDDLTDAVDSNDEV